MPTISSKKSCAIPTAPTDLLIAKVSGHLVKLYVKATAYRFPKSDVSNCPNTSTQTQSEDFSTGILWMGAVAVRLGDLIDAQSLQVSIQCVIPLYIPSKNSVV